MARILSPVEPHLGAGQHQGFYAKYVVYVDYTYSINKVRVRSGWDQGAKSELLNFGTNLPLTISSRTAAVPLIVVRELQQNIKSLVVVCCAERRQLNAHCTAAADRADTQLSSTKKQKKQSITAGHAVRSSCS